MRDPFISNGSVAGITDFTGLQPFLNQLPLNRVDTNAVALLNLFPDPTQGGITNNFAINRSLPDDSQHFDIRVDHNLSVRDQIFGRVSYSKRDADIPADFTGEGDNISFGQGAVKDKSLEPRGQRSPFVLAHHDQRVPLRVQPGAANCV